MVDNLSTDVDKQTNTSYLEQRALLKETTFPGTSLFMPSGIEAEMAESTWLAKHQLTKPTQISQVQWTVNQAPDTTIVSFTFPEVLTAIDSVIRRTLQMYAFYKMSPVFRFQLNATQFHQGQLIISFDPFRQSAEPTITFTEENSVTPIFNRYYATGLPSVKIMASESDPVELAIPYIHPKNYLASNSESDDTYNLLGEIRVTVLNQLRVAEGTSTSLTLTTWVYAHDSSVHVPIQYHDLRVQPTSLISSLSSGLQNGSNLVGNILTGNFGKGLRSGQGLIDDLGKLFGFDYPNRPLAPENTIKNVETLANARGATRSERLALDPVSAHILDTDEKMVSNEMDIPTIIKMPMLINQTNFSSNLAPQSILYYIPVTPTLALQLPAVNGQTLAQPTYLSYISQFFAYWTGSIQFEFEFVATRFHSGKIIVGFIPNDNPSGLTYQSISTSTPSAVIDIQQTSKVSFIVPYQATTPLKATGGDAVVGGNDETILGYLVVAVQNQLSYASNVSPSIDINLYVRAGEDFTFMVPKAPRSRFNIPATPAPTNMFNVEATSDVTFQTSRTGQEDSTTTATLTHGKSHSKTKPRFGETYSMVDCIRRFTPFANQVNIANQTIPSAYPAPDYFAVHPVLYSTRTSFGTTYDSVYTQTLSYLAFFGKLFSCWSGTIRFKFVSHAPRTANSSLSLYHIPDLPWINEALDVYNTQVYNAGYASITTDLSQNTSLELEVPYYSLFNFLLTHPSATETSGTAQPYIDNQYYPYVNGYIKLLSSNANQYPYNVYIAAGEDFEYFYLRSPPQDANVGHYNYITTTLPAP